MKRYIIGLLVGLLGVVGVSYLVIWLDPSMSVAPAEEISSPIEDLVEAGLTIGNYGYATTIHLSTGVANVEAVTISKRTMR